MNLTAQQIKRRGDQSQDTGKDKRRPYRFAGRQTYKQQKGRNRETSSADPGHPNGERD